jgi:hypothetical protein
MKNTLTRKGNFNGKSARRTAVDPSTSISTTGHGYQADTLERMASLFEPDTIAAAQYFGDRRRKSLIEPEKRLMAAILEDAINCFQDNLLAESGKARKLFIDAEEWLFEERSDWLFSFQNVCELLGVNPQYLRRGLLRWKEKTLANRYHPDRWERTKMAG